MTADHPRTRAPVFRTLAVLLLLLALGGCKSKDGGGGIFSRGDSGTKPRDPLVYGPNRIPPQNVPVNDRGGVGARGRTDPLLGSPTGKTGDKTGVGYSDDPERFKGVHVPSERTTPAALAAKKDADELKINDRDDKVPLRPAGGVMPAESGGGSEPASRVEPATRGDPGGGVDGQFADLEKYGVKRDDRSLTREDGKYVFRASVTMKSGARRQYTSGQCGTANEAVKQVLDQVAVDPDRR